MSDGQVDNWVFDSLVNFLHGSIWKVPVVGFIEEKSVVFDPDSYNNMTEEKEEEFRKIHDEYKALVDFMLSSFMEDLQVTPEQVEEACRVREHQSKSLPESHITKVALEQLWAAEDFTAFRRLMTRKNIDLQLQSLELLVAKYGVLSPSLRSGDSEEPSGDDGEDDFLQVVIRYSDQLELFKCDYGEEVASCPGRDNCKRTAAEAHSKDEGKNMKLHLSGIPFKNNVAPTPVNYQATLMSSSSNNSNIPSANPESIADNNAEENNTVASEKEIEANQEKINDTEPEALIEEEKLSSSQNESNSEIIPPTPSPNPTEHNSPPASISPCTSPLPEPVPTPPPTEEGEKSLPEPLVEPETEESLPEPPESETEEQSSKINADESEREKTEVESETVSEKPEVEGESISEKVELDNEKIPENAEICSEEPENSQLIQLEEAEAAMAEESKAAEQADLPPPYEGDADAPPPLEEEEASGDTPPEEPRPISPKQISPRIDEKTVAEIANSAPEQRRLLTAVRKALEINPDDSEPLASIDIPSSLENDEDLQKRREYLRAQRDKLIAMKKQEREKLLLANTSAGGPQSARPKSARAAQMAIRNPLSTMRAASIGSEKSLSARRALADRLKQELIEKQ